MNTNQLPYVSLSNVSVTYTIAHNAARSLRETFINYSRKKSIFSQHEALQGINLEIFEGDTLAILGRNGAGKSTLLKTIARVIPPSDGRVRTRGSVAPLIELGAGFHPDMTGRENAILYGTILGHSSRKMEKRVSDIAEWADLGKFIDLPIRTYSSGMIGRLSFAVATDQAPEIFIVDEVLSVGDAEFQIKSRNRMMEILKKSSCVILVSHDLSTIEKMASKAILLDRGRLLGAGLPADVIVKYRALIAS